MDDRSCRSHWDKRPTEGGLIDDEGKQGEEQQPHFGIRSHCVQEIIVERHEDYYGTGTQSGKMLEKVEFHSEDSVVTVAHITHLGVSLFGLCRNPNVSVSTIYISP